MGKVIGIDLGTTNSVAAIADGPTARVLDTKENKTQLRSIVGYRKRHGKPDEIIVGDVAFNNWPMAPKDTIISIKRLMGRGVADKEVQKVREHFLYQVVEPSDGTKDSVRVVMGGKQYSPEDISAMILGKIKEDAEFRLGEKVTDAIITVPAYFGQAQKAATRRAGQKAGLRVLKILDEPTAAAIAFGMDKADNADPKYLCVYDLGGGTFDISVLMWAGNVFAPLNLEGDMWLGGDNFDLVLINHALKYIEREYSIDPRENLRFMAELHKRAKEAKENLTIAKSTEIIVPGLLQSDGGDLIDVELEITKSQFEDMSRPLVQKSIELVQKALKGADLTASQIDYVIMAGNSSAMPLVQESVEKLFGPGKVKRDIHPKHCVAVGAARLAVRIKGVVCEAADPKDPKRECGHINELDAKACKRCGVPLVLTEGPSNQPDITVGGITSFSYGVQLANDEYHVFIKKGDGYPTEKPESQTFWTIAPNQRMVAIPVFGGDNMERASANEKQASVYAILPPGLPKGTGIRVKVWLDSNMVFDLSACLEDGTDLQPLILKGERDAKAMEVLQEVEAKVAKAVKELPPENAAEAEKVRNEAFSAVKSGRFEEAAALAKKVDQIVHMPPPEDPLRTKAENLVGFTKFVLQQFDWAINASATYRLNQLAEEVNEALSKDDENVLRLKVNELDKETNTLPQLVMVLLNMRGAINQIVNARDPAQAAALMQELDGVEEAFKGRNPRANQMLNELAMKLKRMIDKEPVESAQIKCDGRSQDGKPCDHVFADEMACPKCQATNPKYRVGRGQQGGGMMKTSSGFQSV